MKCPLKTENQIKGSTAIRRTVSYSEEKVECANFGKLSKPKGVAKKEATKGGSLHKKQSKQ